MGYAVTCEEPEGAPCVTCAVDGYVDLAALDTLVVAQVELGALGHALLRE